MTVAPIQAPRRKIKGAGILVRLAISKIQLAQIQALAQSLDIDVAVWRFPGRQTCVEAANWRPISWGECVGYTPPFPVRHDHEPSTWQRVLLGRRNMLSVFSKNSFKVDLVALKLFRTKIFLCNTPELVQYAFNKKNSSFHAKTPTMRHMLKPLAGDGLIISDGPVWRSRREIIAPIIHASRIEQFAPVMIDTAAEMRDRWSPLPDGATVDIVAEMVALTAEVISRAVFGRKLGAENARAILSAFSQFQDAANRVDYLSLFGFPKWLPRFQHWNVYRATRRIRHVVDYLVANYDREKGDKESLISQMASARDSRNGERLDATALRNEAVVMFLAGHETTASTLAFAWFLISQAPKVERRLHRELDTVCGARAPTFADVRNLNYTRAVIEETLRLYPPIPILGREALEDAELGGHTVKKGDLLLVIPWLLHRKKGLWSKPDQFIPERYLPGGSGVPSRWAYLPFSTGPRVCPGMAFGLTEAILCLATLAQQFRLAVAPAHKVEPICRVTLRPGDNLPMTLQRRVRGLRRRVDDAEVVKFNGAFVPNRNHLHADWKVSRNLTIRKERLQQNLG